MLAQQHGLALITEKLQNQRLEEPAAGSSGVTPSGASSFCGKLPTVNQEAYLISDHPGQSTALSVKGKNVWAHPLDSKRPGHGLYQQDTGKHGGTLAQISSPRNIAGKEHHHHHHQTVPHTIPASSLCRHKKLRHYCQICDTAPGTPSAPPKKKHCRSLSVPPDSSSTPTFFPSGKDATSSPSTRFSIGTGGGGSGYGHSSHHYCYHLHQQSHHHNSKIWRPIAVVPLRGAVASNNNINNNNTSSNNNNNSSNNNSINSSSNGNKNTYTTNYSSYSSGNGNGQNKDRSGLTGIQHCSPNYVRHILSPTNTDNDRNNNNSNINISSNTSVSGFEDQTSSCSNYSRLGSISSSGHPKFKLMPPSSLSTASFDSGHFTTSDLQTPPSSPIPQPRPASAASAASYSSAGWFDFSPMRSRLSVLQNRSLSCEDRISGCSSCSSSSPFSSSSSYSTTASMPCVYNSSNTNYAGPGGGGSGGTGDGDGHGSCSGQHGRGNGGEVVPRCHSQPCVLHHRRLGKKRRRDCDRPTLNFNKMTETAYMHSHRKSEPWSGPPYDAQMRLLSGHHGFPPTTSNQNPYFLNPIASSPLDSSELLMSRHLQPHQHPDGVGSSGNRPTMSAGIGGVDDMTLAITPPDVSPRRRDLCSRDHEEEEEEEEDDDDDDDDERNCNCHDSQREPDSMGLFPMGDLDLEQIETH